MRMVVSLFGSESGTDTRFAAALTTPAPDIEAIGLHQAIQDALGNLTAVERRVVEIREFEGRSQVAAARELGISTRRVRAIREAAFASLRLALGCNPWSGVERTEELEVA